MFCVAEVKEYCQFEAFNVTCPWEHVIVMRSALYGRMNVGKCVKGDYGFIGCKSDVMRYISQNTFLPAGHVDNCEEDPYGILNN